jgi:hypothetical protein
VLHFQRRLTTLLRTRPVAASRCPAASCPFRSVDGILRKLPGGSACHRNSYRYLPLTPSAPDELLGPLP